MTVYTNVNLVKGVSNIIPAIGMTREIIIKMNSKRICKTIKQQNYAYIYLILLLSLALARYYSEYDFEGSFKDPFFYLVTIVPLFLAYIYFIIRLAKKYAIFCQELNFDGTIKIKTLGFKPYYQPQIFELTKKSFRLTEQKVDGQEVLDITFTNNRGKRFRVFCFQKYYDNWGELKEAFKPYL